MELKSKMWMTGNLDWFTFIDGEDVYLGRREVPIPLEEGDKWTNDLGDVFQIVDGEIKFLERVPPPPKYW